ncbi:MAG: hypothetical protein KA257_00180 [Opitutaceae bacterium]|nr:hypothetical protein [Opitutaceae bacterium]
MTSPAKFDPQERFRQAFFHAQNRWPTDEELSSLSAAVMADGIDPKVATPSLIADEKRGPTWLSAAQQEDAERAMVLAREHGIKSLTTPVIWFVQNRLFDHERMLDQGIEEFQVAKRCEGVSPISLKVYRLHFNDFMAAYPGRVMTSITPQEIADFILRWNNPYTRAHRWQTLATFYTWAMRMHYAVDNPVVRAMRKPRTQWPERRVMTVEEARAVLRKANENGSLGFWVLAMFAGLRTAEVQRLEALADPWQVIKLDAGVIDLRSQITKTWPRTVPVLPVLRAWLELIKRRDLLFYPRNFHNRCRQVRDAALTSHMPRELSGGHKTTGSSRWAVNIARRSYISYRLAQPQASFAEVSLSAGNSEEVIRKHYHRKVSECDALRYFELFPEER